MQPKTFPKYWAVDVQKNADHKLLPELELTPEQEKMLSKPSTKRWKGGDMCHYYYVEDC
jgi:hypothetical protein